MGQRAKPPSAVAPAFPGKRPSPPSPGTGRTGPLWCLLKAAPAQATVWLELARLYASEGLTWQAAYSAGQALRLDAALLPRLQALNIGAWQDAAAGDALLGRPALADAATLLRRFRARLADDAGDWLSRLYTARLGEMLAPGEAGATPENAQQDALEHSPDHSLRQAQALEPIPGESLHRLGVWRLNAGDAPGAVAALSGLLDIRPVRHGSMMYLGEALQRIGNVAAAEKAFARASLSGNPAFLLTLSSRVYTHNYWQEAIQILQKALAIQPGNVPALLALARIQSEVYMLADCRVSLDRLHALVPGDAQVQLIEAGLQGRTGDAQGHLATLRAAYESGGDPLSRLASSVAMTALYQDGMTAHEIADLHRSVCAPIEAAFKPATAFANSRGTARRLRLGLVTGDLHRQHPVNIFMLPILQRLDAERIELCIYHTGTMHDEYTRQAKACAQRWLEAATLDDTALQRAIAADEVDVLIDLAGHTSTHRLGVFAMRAAPVQATFLGYPHSTGLSTIDWLVGDATVSPAEHQHLFSEGIAQMPGSVFCWAPVDDYALPPARPADAPIVFGSFNNAMKLSPRTMALWAEVLRAVPGSQLLLKAPSLRDESIRASFRQRFAAQGVSPERLVMRGPSGLDDMMQEYGDMDIALDPTPYNGGTTTLQALWMGVPVVALEGGNFVGRMGASFMRTLGKPEWVAQDDAGYVAAAAALAHNVATLRGRRAQLRERMAQSPLCDIAAYTKNFEALIQGMWAAHCSGDARRVLTLPQPETLIS